ncbi:hypothetical protein Kpho02_63260 [Kitasatospora phosalacinea]|uniref:Uncharacterized protein n=1 Tax=Kitasatospora phosalacinea TaxID=2065 RepID=A0A9W6V579_9ACTN|nr:hypothetical protein [Kitasatospora phosalacinea]GLW74028.1 hypothetical protein Kpho02_63260 [Kitasatospora phosalacinea]
MDEKQPRQVFANRFPGPAGPVDPCDCVRQRRVRIRLWPVSADEGPRVVRRRAAPVD